MKKDAYYFPHYSNARNDSKVLKIRRVLGLEGYAIYFMLLEVLRDQKDFKYPIDGIDDLAYEWHTSKEKIGSVIHGFDLFTIQDNLFFSINFIQYMQPYIEKSERARLAAKKRWDNANAYANALPEHSSSNAKRGEENKVKESKEDIKPKTKRFTPPSNQEVKELFKEKGLNEKQASEEAEQFILHYQSQGWKLSNGNAMKDWRSALSGTWMRNYKRFKGEVEGKVSLGRTVRR